MHGGDASPIGDGWTPAAQAIGKAPWIYIIMIICVVVCWVLLERTGASCLNHGSWHASES